MSVTDFSGDNIQHNAALPGAIFNQSQIKKRKSKTL
jgi:hypothetical protein